MTLEPFGEALKVAEAFPLSSPILLVIKPPGARITLASAFPVTFVPSIDDCVVNVDVIL